MQIVDTDNDRETISVRIKAGAFFMDVVAIDADKHPRNNSISLVFFKFLRDSSMWCWPMDHTQGLCEKEDLSRLKSVLRETRVEKLVLDKKRILHFFGEDFDFIDVGISRYLETGENLDDDVWEETNSEIFIRNNFQSARNLNRCVPIFKYASIFEKTSAPFTSVPISGSEKGFRFLNETMSRCFYSLEKNGLKVDTDLFLDHFGKDQKIHIADGFVYSQYNLFTSTGRPSNRFGGVNYAALKKNDGSRCSFISRHGDDGMLVMMDFNAFHPRLIAHLVNYPMGIDVNPYEYLAKYYFPEISSPNEEDVAVSKGLTFQMLYGSIDPRWKEVPYFKKVQEYINHRWKFFENNGYIETPIFLRKIKSCHIEDPTPTKLFNYILQAYETEFASVILEKVMTLLDGYKTIPILYTYDSVLFDAHKSDTIEVIRSIKKTMEGEKFPVKVYVGKNYHQMEKISV